MTDQFSAVSRVTTIIAGIIAATITLLVPLGYYLISRQYIETIMQADNELLASSINRIVSNNPKNWRFEEIRVSEILHRHLENHNEGFEMLRVRDIKGMVVAEAIKELPLPLIVRAGTVFDAGEAAGHVELSRSLRPIIERTVLIAILSSMIGGLVFVVLRLIPMRAVGRALFDLARSESRYRYFFENSEVGIFELAAAGWTFVTVNPKIEMILGLPAAKVKGLPLAAFLEDQGQLHRLKKLIHGMKLVQNYELTFKADDGRSKTILTTLKYDDSGVNIEGTAFDISDIKVLQKKLEEEQSRMVHAGRLASLGEMATGIAHEINQPLTIINLAMQYLEATTAKSGNDPMALQSIKKVKAQVERASKIIKNMRAFARGGSSTKLERTDVAEVINAALTFFREQFRVNDIALTVSLGSGLPQAVIDPQKFEQVIVNLLSNARYAVQKKFKQTGGVGPMQVSVTLFHDLEQNALVVEVVDNGAGMSETELRRCLEPFFTTKEVGQGTGIGLSISYNIVKEFDGHLEVDSEQGKGSLFRILLPLVE